MGERTLAEDEPLAARLVLVLALGLGLGRERFRGRGLGLLLLEDVLGAFVDGRVLLADAGERAQDGGVDLRRQLLAVLVLGRAVGLVGADVVLVDVRAIFVFD